MKEGKMQEEMMISLLMMTVLDMQIKAGKYGNMKIIIRGAIIIIKKRNLFHRYVLINYINTSRIS
jgi:hypothetical protein